MSSDKKQTVGPSTRTFSEEGVSPFDSVEWEKRDVEITDETGTKFFLQTGVEAPKSWSPLAVKIAASKYFYGEIGAPNRENSIKQLIHRVCRTIADWAHEDGYTSKEQADVFYDELAWLCVNQHMAFNSPVWFNVGLYRHHGVRKPGTKANWIWPTGGTYDGTSINPSTEACLAGDQYRNPQCSACFIQSVDDNMESIMQLATNEAMLFKFGSGTGTSLSTLRSFKEKLSGGGKPSGPLSFLRIYDQVANVVKSGGKTRRAAKMNVLHSWHGDIEEFIDAKQLEEKKAWTLAEAGFTAGISGDAYSTVAYQNENLSVRLSDDFMNRATGATVEPFYWTRAVTSGHSLEKKNAKELLRKIAEGAWICGDPGVQFDDVINKWHTCPNSGRINATNPCSEYIFLDDTACNLASLNLLKFVDDKGKFDTELFSQAVSLVTLAQEVLIDRSSYPSKQIAENSHKFRSLGLGYANLGALLMQLGLPYDSSEGRTVAGHITALMTAVAYQQSSFVAEVKGAFDGYEENAAAMQAVISAHYDASTMLERCPQLTNDATSDVWLRTKRLGNKQGYRNAQLTVLAPTGTIGFMMDCDTTGVEPDLGLVKYKSLVGGGSVKIVNQTVSTALRGLGYSAEEVDEMCKYIESNDTIEGAPGLKAEHLPVFDCAFVPANGTRSIHYMGHVRMMASAQPFLSGGISKTVNMPNSSTVEEILEVYVKAWQLGLKCVAVYRDGSKKAQPLNLKKGEKRSPVRTRMPETRTAITHKFDIANHEGYLTIGFFEDGLPGEVFIQMAKEGSTIGGLMDTIGTLTSIALQYGVPLPTLVEKFAHQRFEPSGFTKNKRVKQASSVIDYVFRWIQDYVSQHDAAEKAPPVPVDKPSTENPACPRCGYITVRNGTCHRCANCGESLGCS
jgi:ribonucleoside-diphosphate reductase alpha chain